MFPSLDNCIRQEKGYCRVKYTESSTTTPDPFDLDTATAGSAAAAGGTETTPTNVACALNYVQIPNGSENGVSPLNAQFSTPPQQTTWCGTNLGYTPLTTSMDVVCKFS